MCECETGFWGALPHKHPPSTSGTGSCLCCWQPWWINTFCSPAGDASLQKNIKTITWIRRDTPDNLVSKPWFTLISNHLRSPTSSQNECIPDTLYDASSTSSFNPTGWWDFRNMSIQNNYSFIFIISCEAKAVYLGLESTELCFCGGTRHKPSAASTDDWWLFYYFEPASEEGLVSWDKINPFQGGQLWLFAQAKRQYKVTGATSIMDALLLENYWLCLIDPQRWWQSKRNKRSRRLSEASVEQRALRSCGLCSPDRKWAVSSPLPWDRKS